MRPTALSPRLRAVADAVPSGAVVADVGADHGRLALELLASGRARRCFVTEVTPARLEHARRRLSGRVDPARIAFRAGDGLAALGEDEVPEAVVIAGLGGRTLVRLLRAAGNRLSRVRRLIVQPQTEAPTVREALVGLGWRFVDERLVVDAGRAYVVIAAEPGDGEAALRDRALTRADWLAAGPLLARSGAPEVAAHWRRRLARLAGFDSPRAAAEARQAVRILRFLESVTSAPGGRTSAPADRRGSAPRPRRTTGP